MVILIAFGAILLCCSVIVGYMYSKRNDAKVAQDPEESPSKKDDEDKDSGYQPDSDELRTDRFATEQG
jgi:hypothetical protein